MARSGSIVVMRMLNGAEQEIVRRCLVAMLDGDFIDDWEFQTRLGLSRDALRAILKRPELDNSSEEEDVQLAINNCMNELLNGLSISSAEWDQWLPMPKQEVERTFIKWNAQNRSGS